jgi:excisionase family DNA binding protein
MNQFSAKPAPLGSDTQDRSDGVARLLRVEEVAEILQVSRSFGYQLVNRGDIPSVHLGRAVRVRFEDLQRFIESNVSSSSNPVCGGAR